MGFGFQRRHRLFSFGLQRVEAQDLAELVALVQNLKLVNKGGGTVSFEAFISGKKYERKKIVRKCIILMLNPSTAKDRERNAHPFLVVAIPTSVSFIPTPEK